MLAGFFYRKGWCPTKLGECSELMLRCKPTLSCLWRKHGQWEWPSRDVPDGRGLGEHQLFAHEAPVSNFVKGEGRSQRTFQSRPGTTVTLLLFFSEIT